ncbi:DET1 homolog [Episyrphus balteatus]|uniref:DET1 homolog n=1 Tax=Episyrphus balteatus TaxID=286459 RepID=UPI002486182C|nr:DET1 homolog [Episyrphus balteatus]
MEWTNQHTFVPREKSMNLVHLLRDREIGIDRRYSVHRRKLKDFDADFFKCITPNLTIANVEKHFNFIRKFTPDGKYLICFSRDQQSFESYKFLGTTRVCPLLYHWKTEYVPPDCNNGLGGLIRRNIFNELFRLHWSIQLSSTFMRPLYREFSIFTEDGKYIIIASHTPIAEEHLPSYYTMGSINCMHFEYDLFSYRFYLIRLRDGSVSDTMEFQYDFIKLSHNHGVSLKGNLMVVVSLLHQTINLVKLKDGKFIRLNTLGVYPHGTDECLCKHVPEYEKCCQTLDNGLSGFKQKIVIFLYNKVMSYPIEQRPELLKMFYQRLYIYEAMQIYKLQFLDEDHLLIRYDLHKHPEVETAIAHKFFVLYNLPEDEIIKISAENAFDLLLYFVYCCDTFRDTRSLFTGRAPSSSSNNMQIRCAQQRIIHSFPRGFFDAAYRLLPQIPLAVQSYSASPYLDLNLFHYDTQLVSALERPRYSNCEPINFSDRTSKLLLFRMYFGIFNYMDNNVLQQQYRGPGGGGTVGGGAAAAAGGTAGGVSGGAVGGGAPPSAPKELLAFVFHPIEPFFISVQKLENRYVTNFHIRNEGTILRR